MKTLFKPGWVIFAAVMSLPAGAEDFPEVKQLMSREEFEMTGMSKLDKEELKNLRRWLQVFVERDADFLRNTTEIKDSDTPEDGKLAISAELRSTIVGEFTGWTGKTKFKLANGQIWQQRVKGTYRFKATDREVIIRKNFLGFYVMEMIAAGRKVKVKRIR